jgi:hypothetical protein
MNNKPDFSFDRTLTPEELNFWTSFFDHFPFEHNQNIQFMHSSFLEQLKKLNDSENYYEKIKILKTKDELDSFIREQAIPPFNKEAYSKIIDNFDKIFPDSRPIEIFLMSMYGATIQSWKLGITKNGINILPNEESISVTNYVPQLAMIADFMNERASQIFPNLNLQPIKISGEKILFDKENNERILFKIEKNCFAKQLSEDNNKIFSYDFSHTFSENNDYSQQIYSPFDEVQSRFIKTIEKHFLEQKLDSKQNCSNKRIKI